METMGPVEKTVRYAANLESLTAAWAFVMETLEKVGPDPSVHISPVWVIYTGLEDNEPVPRHFSVVVEGMIEEGTDDDEQG